MYTFGCYLFEFARLLSTDYETNNGIIETKVLKYNWKHLKYDCNG